MSWKPDYIVLGALRSFVNIDDPEDTQDDAFLSRAITAASRAVDKHCGRQFGKTDTVQARRYTARWHSLLCRWVADIDDLMTITGLVVEVDSAAVTDYELTEYNAVADGEPWTRLEVLPSSAVQPTGVRGGLTVTATWGWTTVPVQVEEATLLQGSRFFARRQSPYGVAGSPDAGSELRLLSRLDPDVGVALSGLIRRVAR